MNPPNMILHIIHTAENLPTPIPLTPNPRVMFGLVARAILLTREPALRALRASLVSAEEVFPVSVEVFAEVAASSEDSG